MMKNIRIDKKTIGCGRSCFIIAEAGVNHNGKYQLAKKLVDAAVDAKADAVKFQTFKADEVVTDYVKKVGYQRRNTGGNGTQRQMLESLQLQYNSFLKLKMHCDRRGIIFLSTPHSFGAIDFLESIVPAYKFGSGDITNLPAIEYAAKKGKPIILATGMATLKEVKEAVNAIRDTGNDKIVLLQCTTNYPCPPDEVNLRAMRTMNDKLGCLVGLSDHTFGSTAAVAAVALGAVVLEKHFTISRNLSGPDHKASLEPDELKEWIKKVRMTEIMLGSQKKLPTDSERKIMKDVRKSIIAKKDIEEGRRITLSDLIIKRPASGLEPKLLAKVVGRIARKGIKRDEPIKMGLLR
jgi:N,N'-diacetyllegionaminate synthase